MHKSSSQIRQEFLNFFKEKGHKIVPSASVIPYNDPSLLFTNAGMNQFKDVFLGTGTRDYTRCADTQKCIRVSGKHNDLEEVGHDGYHHTFFEMLGNWSFGDYYKKEAIGWAWELFTEVWKLPKDKLWATVYNTDDEAYNYWKSETDINPDHILRFGEKDNFWEMGETGPCGPCSEIHIDLTKDGCKAEDINTGINEVELWNLVFIQFNRDEKGVLHDLPKKHVDTGMGFERVVSILQNKKSNYETDVFLPLINELEKITGTDYKVKLAAGKIMVRSSIRVIADHIRALTFAIADGVIPSNEKRGYVLRRILRRAAFYGKNLGMHKPFMFNLVDILVKTMGNVFPEIIDKKKFIKKVIESEEENFIVTLDSGLIFFNEEVDKMEEVGSKVFSGEVAFKLHDTYGFPIDLTQLMARELGYEVDIIRFNDLMNEQKERAREAKKGEPVIVFRDNPVNTDVIYNPYNINKSGIQTIAIPSTAQRGENEYILTLKNNPFYSESGGQVSDTGKLIIGDKTLDVIDSRKNYIIVKKPDFPIFNDVEVIAKVDFDRRQAIQRNHSATHLLHETLRRILGKHVRQMGSYLDDVVLRFDFNHFNKLTENEIKAVEDLVNEKIEDDLMVETSIMKLDDAKRYYPNLKMFFGEKYEDIVRVVITKGFCEELCGGTHVKQTKDIGFFKIIKEESVSTGTRRIVAKTGEKARDYIGVIIENEENVVRNSMIDLNVVNNTNPIFTKKFVPELKNLQNKLTFFKNHLSLTTYTSTAALQSLSGSVDSTSGDIWKVSSNIKEEKKQSEKQLAKQKVQNASALLDEIISKGYNLNGINIVTAKFDVNSMDELKEIGDSLRLKIGSGIGLIYTILDGKVNIVTVVSDDLIKEKGLNAGKIAGDFSRILGGGGGGKPHLATAGGKDIDKLDTALNELNNIIQKYLSAGGGLTK